VKIIGGAEAVEAVRDGAVEPFVVDVCTMVRTNERGSMGWCDSTCLVSTGSEPRSGMGGRASVARCSDDARGRWLRFHHLIHESEVVLAFCTCGIPLVLSSPDDNNSSSSLFALAAGDGEREIIPWFLCLSVDCRHFDKASVRGDPSERVIYLGTMYH